MNTHSQLVSYYRNYRVLSHIRVTSKLIWNDRCTAFFSARQPTGELTASWLLLYSPVDMLILSRGSTGVSIQDEIGAVLSTVCRTSSAFATDAYLIGKVQEQALAQWTNASWCLRTNLQSFLSIRYLGRQLNLKITFASSSSFATDAYICIRTCQE